MIIDLVPEPLTQQAFAPFGKVIEMTNANSFLINEGTTTRYHALAKTDIADQTGETIISIFESHRRDTPIQIKMMEKHPLGSQAFLPAQAHDWLIVVATGDVPTAQTCKVFLAKADQGVQYAKNVWHHPLLPIIEKQNFWVVDRLGEGNNLIEHYFSQTMAQIII